MQEQLPDNIYATIAHPEKRTIEEALAYDYDFSIMEVLSQAWSKVNGIKLPFFLAILILSIVNTLITVFLEIIPEQIVIVLNIVISILISGLSASFAVIALKQLRGEKLIDVIQCFKSLSGIYFVLVIANFIMFTIIFFGFLLFIIPGIYLSLAYCLVEWIIIDNPNITAWQALEASRKLITRHWFKVFGLYFLLTIIIILSIIPLCIGLIWTIPLTVLSTGILYQTIFEKSNTLIV